MWVVPEVLAELLEIIGSLRCLGSIMRISSFFRSVNNIRKLEAVLKEKDIKEIILKSKKVRDYVLNQLFSLQLKSNHFIFFDEKDLINFVKSRDREAKILKLLELKEVDLYIVEGKIFSNKWDGLLNVVSFYLLFNSFNLFYSNVINEFEKLNNDLQNELKKIKDEILNKLKEMEDKIINKLNEEKNEDIANTYCLSCSCCCSCSCNVECEGKEESYTESCSCNCCCSCECNLIHYAHSWDILRDYIQNQFITFENFFNTEINNYSDYMKKRILEDKDNSLKAYFIMLFNELMKIFFTKIKEKYLFAVIKENEIIKEIKKEAKKTGVMRILYEFLKSKKGKWEYNKLLEEIQHYLYWKLSKKYTKTQVRVLFWTIKKRYMEEKIKVVWIRDKRYIIIEG